MPAPNIRDITAWHQSKVTERLIEAEGQDITLTRPVALVPDGAGSYTSSGVGTDTMLPTVKRFLTGLTMVGRGVNQQPERWIVTNIGKRYKQIFVMIGLPDDDVQPGDYWDTPQGRMEVIFIHPVGLEYQTKAEVILVADD